MESIVYQAWYWRNIINSFKQGFLFTIEGNKKYNEFIRYFGIGSGKGQFSIKEFVSHLNVQVPNEYKISDSRRNVIISYDKLDSDSDGIYPIGVTNWEVAHAKDPSLSRDKYHRTNKNLLKTKELYRDIYNAMKDMDITINKPSLSSRTAVKNKRSQSSKAVSPSFCDDSALIRLSSKNEEESVAFCMVKFSFPTIRCCYRDFRITK